MKIELSVSLLLALLLLPSQSLPVQAAEPADETVQSDESTETASDSAQTAADADAALEEEIRAADEAAASNATPAPAGRNESFVPTVRISEDLSVSFPVDI